MADAMIHFIQKHQPALGSGDYILDVTLTNPAAPANRQPHIQRQFTVAGERFALKPADIQAVFPPAGSLGDHSKVLPHISLSRSTLPWERLAIQIPTIPTNRDVPWLALLLFEEQEAPHSALVPLHDIKEPYKWFNPKTSKYEGFDLEIGQRPADQVTVIDVPRPILTKILPTHPKELQYLAHVRIGADEAGCAVVIGSRLPKQGGTSVVHLVSLEGCYHEDPGTKEVTFNDPQSDPKDIVRLISLYSWRFACEDADQSFSQLLRRLDCGKLRLPQARVANADAEAYLELGCVLLPHSILREEQTIQIHSWYHGPLLPVKNKTTEDKLSLLPARRAEDLRRFDASLGMVDVSYAAAWELGRFLALQSTTFSTELFNWKRSRGWRLQPVGKEPIHLSRAAPALEPLPPAVITWFERLEHLDGIPFNYLLPDERMLRPESLRFFTLDWFWMECLQDGALSIGRVTKADQDQDKAVKELLDRSLGDGHLSRSASQVTGFLLRSEVVSGWPGLLVNGYDSTGASTLLLTRRLATDILLCLFTGELARFEIYLKAESMNFGVDGTDPSDFEKKPRKEAGNSTSRPVRIPWRKDASDARVIDIAALAQDLEVDNSAHFAFQMIEGVEKVSFELH